MFADNARKDASFEQLERLRIAEERGDIDENVLKQRLDLDRMVPQVFGVLVERLDLVQRHASRDPATQRRGLVIGEVDTRVVMQQPQDLCGLRAVDDALRRSIGTDIGVAGNVAELARDIRGG